MLADMPAGLFAQWCEYDRLEPWGDEVTNNQLASLCAIIAQFAGVKDAKVGDFLPIEKEPPKPKSNEELHAKFTQFAGLHNAKVNY